ncbi:hypothetical protein B0H17DRAFT_1124882 [Mycena rosella]|uniref:Uncharacterized protein n=1 Tax=Mycena rosella TaxID=1033263 RepID=A0AAD7GYR9_MYCRO|nr:hypothetical protein B0H17DRAFT_1124882 [Mycena rosella]
MHSTPSQSRLRTISPGPAAIVYTKRKGSSPAVIPAAWVPRMPQRAVPWARAARAGYQPRGLVREFGRLVERQDIIDEGSDMLRANTFILELLVVVLEQEKPGR